MSAPIDRRASGAQPFDRGWQIVELLHCVGFAVLDRQPGNPCIDRERHALRHTGRIGGETRFEIRVYRNVERYKELSAGDVGATYSNRAPVDHASHWSRTLSCLEAKCCCQGSADVPSFGERSAALMFAMERAPARGS